MNLYILLLLSCLSFLHSFDLGQGQIHGFVSQGYIRSNENNYLVDSKKGSFEFTDVGINYTQPLTDQLHVGIQMLARDLGQGKNSRVMVDWAVADWHYKDWLGLRTGKIKLPIGLHNEYRDVDAARTFILLPQALYSEAFRDIQISHMGGAAYGYLPLKKFGSLEYQCYLGTISLEEDNPQSELLFKTIQLSVPIPIIQDEKSTIRYIFGGQVKWNTPLEGLLLALSGARGQVDFGFSIPIQAAFPGGGSFDSRTTWKLWVASAEYMWDDFVFTGEFRRFDVPIMGNLTLVGIGTMPAPAIIASDSWYASVEYRISDDFQLGGYYSVYYRNRDDKNSTPDQYQKDVDLTLRFDPCEWVSLKLEGHYIEGTGDVPLTLNPLGKETHWLLGLFKVTANF